MKQFRIEKIVLDQLSESVQELVDKNYFIERILIPRGMLFMKNWMRYIASYI